MNPKLLISSIILLLIIPLVIAPAGGSGGGSNSGSSSSSSGGGTAGESSSSGGGDGPYFYGLECFDTGQITFKQKPRIKPVITEKADGTNLTLAGDWDGTTFISEEAEITEKGTYTIHDPQNGDKTVECPGLKFSCKLVKIDLQECFYANGNITATFSLVGKDADIEDLKYHFRKLNSLVDLEYQRNIGVSPELKRIKLKKIGNNTFLLGIVDVPLVSTLKITYPKCFGKYYVSSKIECINKEELYSSYEAIINPTTNLSKENVTKIKSQKPSSVKSSILQWIKSIFIKNRFS